MSQPSTSATDMSAIYLTQDDVERLLKEDSADARVNVLEKISDNYANKAFGEREFMFAEQIFRLLMKDTEVRVRQILAERVKDDPDMPRDIILHLAQDVDDVSVPVLEASKVLSDADLIKIAESSREVSKLVAISKRDRVSTRVSHALVETSYPQVVKTLLDNEGADIADQDVESIANDFNQEEAVTEALVKRANLPLNVVEKLVNHVSDSIAEQLKEKYNIDATQAEQEARERITIELMSAHTSDEEIEAMIDQMIAHDRLSPSIIFSALCHGYVRFFEIALAKLAHIPVTNAHKLVHDKGAHGFRGIYQKTGMPESMYGAVRALLDVTLDLQEKGEQAGTDHYTNMAVQELLTRSNQNEIENLSYIIALVRQAAKQ